MHNMHMLHRKTHGGQRASARRASTAAGCSVWSAPAPAPASGTQLPSGSGICGHKCLHRPCADTERIKGAVIALVMHAAVAVDAYLSDDVTSPDVV
jgi:hypothetical protein